MKRCLFFRVMLWLTALAGVTSTLAEVRSPARPNVVFIFLDDMRWDSIAALGNPVAITPNLDALVRRGLSFNNAYCLGGNVPAVCIPSRNMLLSGKTYFRWENYTAPGPRVRGLLAPGEKPNFADSFRDAGYLTCHIGKEGASAPLLQARFEINRYVDKDVERTSGEPGRLVAEEAIRVLREKPAEQPIFMYLGSANPHDAEGKGSVARPAAEKYMKLYDLEKVPLPVNFRPIHPFDNGDMTRRAERSLPWPRSPEVIRRLLHEYYAVLTATDFYIGQILRELERCGELDNTLVIFSADQGISLGSQGLLAKQNLYEDGMKVPLIFAGPGVTPGRSDAMVYLLDIFPTVCDYAGLPQPLGIDGRSFRKTFADPATPAREELFLSYGDVQRAYRQGDWKLIRYPQVDITQLFNLHEDPYEMKDRSGESGESLRLAAMMDRLEKIQVSFGDRLPLRVSDPKPSQWTPPRN